MVCSGLSIYGENMTLINLFTFPTTCNYYFYGWILAGLFITISLIIYRYESETNPKPDFISIFGVSALVILLIALVGTLTTPPIIQRDIFLYTLAYCIVVIAVWFFKK